MPGWIDHDGLRFPLSVGEEVTICTRTGKIETIRAGMQYPHLAFHLENNAWTWASRPHRPADVVRYRPGRSISAFDLLRSIAEKAPETPTQTPAPAPACPAFAPGN